jgi:hypothetical protein
MNWRLNRGGQSAVRKVRTAALGGPESLEVRQLLSVSPASGIESAATRQIDWQGHSVAVHVDRWVGRFDAAGGQAVLPSASLPSTAWKAHSLGGGFFSLTTPGASVQDVLAWARHTAGVRAFEPDFVIHASAVSNDPAAASQWALNKIGATTAWNTTTGSRSVVVATIDSGIDLTHPDLAANVWTGDRARAERLAERLEFGIVWINAWLLRDLRVPFGGVKQSGLGREGSHHGMDDYVEIKFLCLGDVLK